MIHEAHLAVLTVCMAAVLAGTYGLAGDESVTLNGEIEVADYDENGNAKAVMVYDSEWGSVLISSDGQGSELLNHVGAIATLTGTISELDDESGYAYTIHVSRYTIEKPPQPDDPDWDPEY